MKSFVGINSLEELASDGSASGVEQENNDDLAGITNPFDPNDINIKTAEPTIEQVIRRIEKSRLNLTPGFQRKGGIWKIKQKSQLIESLILRIPLPVFYVASDKNDNWLVVDGLQRLTTLYNFISDEEKNTQKFTLKELEFLENFNGKSFKELPYGIQGRILETQPTFHIIQAGTPKGVTQTIFKRINTGGLPLSAQEIRHALYQGKSTQLLKELAESVDFLSATDNSISDDRMADRECVLRFLAFRMRKPQEYTVENMDKFLSDAMELLNNQTDEQIAVYRNLFKRTMNYAYQIFGKYAFRKRRRDDNFHYPINKALFETWSVGLSQYNNQQLDKLVENKAYLVDKFIELIEGSEFPDGLTELEMSYEKTISQQTANVKSVHFRFKAVRCLIEQTLKECE